MKTACFIFLFIGVFASCQKSGGSVVSPLSPVVFSISPTSGSGGTIVTIKGSNFSPTTADDVVEFNGTAASVQSAFIDSLVVLAPNGGTSGNVSVSVNGKTAKGPVFTYDSVDVYGAGIDNASIAWWKNGVENYIGTTENYDGGAFGIAVSDTNVYICGYDIQDFAQDALFWSNGLQTILSGGFPQTGEAEAITISGSDIYIAGQQPQGNGDDACYWKNGTLVYLPNGEYGNAIAVSGSDVYVAGYSNDSSVYWKNGMRTVLAGNAYIEEGASGIAVSGTDVYVTGQDNGQAVYWKNGKETVLSNVPYSTINAITISGNDIFMAGTVQDQAVYWKNGVPTFLPSNQVSAAYCMYIYGSDCYVGGTDGTQEFTSACYWKNGIKQTSSFTTGLIFSKMYAIKVVKHK